MTNLLLLIEAISESNFSKISFSEAAHAFDTVTPVLQFLLKTLMFTYKDRELTLSM